MWPASDDVTTIWIVSLQVASLAKKIGEMTRILMLSFPVGH